MKPNITITFCTLCNWLLRSGWLAQELLSSFGEDIGSVTLVPAKGGMFTIAVGDHVTWDRTVDGGFPDAKELKRRLHDHVWPGRELGHNDRDKTPA